MEARIYWPNVDEDSYRIITAAPGWEAAIEHDDESWSPIIAWASVRYGDNPPILLPFVSDGDGTGWLDTEITDIRLHEETT